MIRKKFCIIVYKKLKIKEQKNFKKRLSDLLKIIPEKCNLYILDMSKFYFGSNFKLSKKLLNNKINYIIISNNPHYISSQK